MSDNTDNIAETLQQSIDAVGVKVPQAGEVTQGKATLPLVSTKPSNFAERPLAARVNTAVGATVPRPAGVRLLNTTDLAKRSFLHCVLYSETSARKTTIAATFDSPQYVRGILTRNDEQLIPLQSAGYQYAKVEDSAALLYALRYPEQLWPDWAKMDDPQGRRTIVLDDATKAVDMLLNSNAAKDRRQSYTGAKEDLDTVLPTLHRKPYNLILICMAKVKDNPLTNEERISPDLPPSIMNWIMAEFEGVFFVKVPATPAAPWRILTDRDKFAYTDIDPNTGKDRTYSREVFSKHKVDLSLATRKPPVLLKEEEPNLRVIWEKMRKATAELKKI